MLAKPVRVASNQATEDSARETVGRSMHANRTRIPRRLNSSTMEGLMGAAKEAMGGGGEAPPHDPAEAEASVGADNTRRQQTRR